MLANWNESAASSIRLSAAQISPLITESIQLGILGLRGFTLIVRAHPIRSLTAIVENLIS